MLDCQRRAAGGLIITATMGANVGPRIFVLGFVKAGISIIGGHETMIHETWLGEFLYSDTRSHDQRYLAASAIQIYGNDHYVTNTIVFSSKIGIDMTGAANLLSGVHTWNLDNQHGGIGILINAPGYTQNRLVGCYLDYNDIVAVDPEHLTITDGFFLCTGRIVLKASTAKHVISGLVIVDNEFDDMGASFCGATSIILDESEAKFTGVFDTVINNNMFTSKYTVASSQADAQQSLKNATKWEFDFSKRLLFTQIQSVQYSIQVNQARSFIRHSSRMPQGNTVAVETDMAADATVFIHVDQSMPSHPCTSSC